MRRKVNVLVCGASGFIGKNVVKKLSQNNKYDLYCVYRTAQHASLVKFCKKVNWFQSNLIDGQSVDCVLNEIDVVIQCAAVTSGINDTFKQPQIHVTNNAIMNSLLQRIACKYKVKHFIALSCSTLYQHKDAGEQFVSEDDFDPRNEIISKYFGSAWTKIYMEKMCEFYSSISDVKFTVIRPSNIVGTYDKFNIKKSHVFASLIKKVCDLSEGDNLKVWGDGTAERDFLHVDDLVRFIELVIEDTEQKYTFNVFNAGSGKRISIKDLAEKILIAEDKKNKILFLNDMPSINTKISLNIEKAKQYFGWEPMIDLDTTIKKTIEWYKNDKT